MNAFWQHMAPFAYLLIALAQLGTFFHIAARWYANYKIQRAFVRDMATNHLPHIYHGLKEIAGAIDVELTDPPPIRWLKINGDKPSE